MALDYGRLSVPTPSSPPGADHELRAEAIQFSRYLIGAEPTEELIARYCAACAILLTAPPPASDRKILAFARAHPWSIALFDASTGASPGSLFRKKLLVMMALLETTPRFVEQTSPVTVGWGKLIVRVGKAGAVMAGSLAAGLALTFAITGAVTHGAPR